MSSNHAPRDEIQVGAGADRGNALTGGILSVAIGLIAVMGGGTLGTAFQYFSFEFATNGSTAEDSGFFVQTMTAVPPLLLGVVAIGIGVVAARSAHPVAAATGRAGVALGILAVFGGVVMALAVRSADFM